MKKRISLLLIAATVLFATEPGWSKKEPASNEAADQNSPQEYEKHFGLYPPIVELECPAGQRVTTTIKIDNPGKLPGSYLLEPVGLVTGVGASLTSRPISSLPMNHLSRHLSFESRTILIPAKSFREISINIDIPADLKGSQYTGLTVASDPGLHPESLERKSEYQTEVGFGMLPGIGVTIKCLITGTLNYAYEVESVQFARGTGNAPASVTMKVKNTGNTEIPIYGMLLLLDSSKKVAGRLKTSRLVSLYPGGIASVDFESPVREIPKGKYQGIFTPVAADLNLPSKTAHVQVP